MPAGVTAQSGEGAASSGSALDFLRRGDYAGAQKQVDQMRRTSPGDRYIAELSGVLLLDGGDAAGALSVFTDASSRTPAESLLNYGTAIAEIGLGDLSSAERALKACELNGGDAECVRLGRRYLGFLRGNYLKQTGLMSSADLALDGLSAMRFGRHREATELLEKAITSGGGDPFLQSTGPLMSFDAGKAISPAFEPISAKKDPAGSEHAVGGEVLVSPDEVPRGTAYAAYELDGEALSIVGTRPYSYTWDTRRAANGRHKITIVLYNAAGDEITRTDRTILVSNTATTVGSLESDGEDKLRAALWQVLTLKPDRCACAYTIGSAYRALGDKPNARVWFSRAAAVRTGYRDTWARLQECGGVNRPGATVYSGRSDENFVALTFDDGPKPGVTEPLLDVLTAAHVPATFFVIGKHIEEYPALARAISSAGMEIENHSYTHRSLTALSIREAEQEMLQTQAAVMTITGKMPRYIRPPGGNWNNSVASAARQWGLTPCMWSVDVFDAEIIGSQKVTETVLSQVKPGSIILMHNGKVSTLQALPNILHTLRSRGYRFLTVDELARRASGTATIKHDSRTESGRPHSE